MNNTERNQLLPTLGVLSALTFIVLLAVYVVISGKPVGSRLGFASLVAIVPSLLAVALFQIARLGRSRWAVVGVYVGLLVLLQLLMEGLR